MFELTGLDWFETSGRGLGVVCRRPEEIPERGKIPEDVLKCGDTVVIDGKTWRVRGIEYYLTNPPKIGEYLSMLVAPTC